VVPGPPFGIDAPPFHVWPTGRCIHPILYFKNVAPLLVFGPLLLNSGDGPEPLSPLATSMEGLIGLHKIR